MNTRRSQRIIEKSANKAMLSSNRQSMSGDDDNELDALDNNMQIKEVHDLQNMVNVPIIDMNQTSDSEHRTVISRKSSVRSTTSTAERRIFEARAASRRAEMEAKRLNMEAERVLMEARLQEEEAALDCQGASSQESVLRWVDQTNVAHSDIDCAPITKVQPSNFNNRSTDHPNSDLSQLTKAITDAFKMTTSSAAISDKLLGRLSAKDLPIFSGDPLDWLRFKNAYTTTTEIGLYTDAENIARLQRCLQGDAWESVAAQLVSVTSADRIMRTLELRFGRSDLILHKLIEDMKKAPILTGSRSDFIIFATKVSNCVAAIKATKQHSYLYSPELSREITDKLTEPLVYRWLDYVSELDEAQPRLPALADYLMMEAERMCRAGAVELPQRNTRGNFTTKRSLHLLTKADNDHNITLAVKDIELTPCTFCQKPDHGIAKCDAFVKQDIDSRWKWVCENKYCFICLKSKHRSDRCKQKLRCNTCKRRHHTLLHKDKVIDTTLNDKKETTANILTKDKKIFLKVLPVHLDGPLGTVSTFALLDEGSTVTLLERDIAEEIGAQGPPSDLVLQGAIGDRNIMPSSNISIILRSPGGIYKLDRVRTIDKLSLPVHTLDENAIRKYSHLNDLPIQSFHGQPKILIGQDFWHLIVTRETREGKKNEPVASRTLLGWVLHGFLSTLTMGYPELNLHLRENCDADLHDLVRDFFKIESFSVDKKDRITAKDRRALQILNDKSKRVDGRWETGLLWKHDKVEFPNNSRNAENRLFTVEKKMDKDPNYARDYVKQINYMIEKNYAKEVKEKITGKNVWYLPHFGVVNVNKPGKLRLVFDAKAETHGVSMDSELLTGPDLMNSLVGVLIRFRERAVAVVGDIREMFLQVKIIEEDQKAQCFLWRGMDRTSAPRTYKMTSMIFGATSSPCTATYILRRNADDYEESHPRAVIGIKRRHYVDDYLDTEEEMKQLILDVAMIHQAGGFEIKGWVFEQT